MTVRRTGYGAQRDTARAIVRDHKLTLADREEFVLRYVLAEEAGEVPRVSNRYNHDAWWYANTLWTTGTATGSEKSGWLLDVLGENDDV